MNRTPHWRCDGCTHLAAGSQRCKRSALLPDLTRDHVLGRAPDWCPADGKPVGAGMAVHRSAPTVDTVAEAAVAAMVLRLGNELAQAAPTTQRDVAEAALRIASDRNTKPAEAEPWRYLATRLNGAALRRPA